jgi:pyruvate dehydrogenase kinase 2/3/4
MRDEWASSELIRSQGLTRRGNASYLAAKAMRLKLSGQIRPEVSERRQVGDAEEMFAGKKVDQPWWRNVGMEEGM